MGQWVLKGSVVVIFLFWFSLFYLLITSHLPSTVIAQSILNKVQAVQLGRFFPEGFSFFTRNPREPQAYLFEGLSREKVIKPNNSSSYWFGIKRDGRAVNVELASILVALQSAEWYDCFEPEESCFDNQNVPIFYIENENQNALICGDFFVKIAEPIPWAWADAFKSKGRQMPCKLVKISVTCK
jgi:antimicrobial peptide system SdpA family protein